MTSLDFPKGTATIDNWWYDKPNNILWGVITNHINRNVNGSYTHTSDIKKLDEENGTCETVNTIFTLKDKKRTASHERD